MNQINKDTQVCISISKHPSNFGTTVHNSGYDALGLNYIYKAFGITDIIGAINGVRALDIRGCSVSMPFKEDVIPLLDKLDSTAKMVRAVNTIVNNKGVLTGYNTDVLGAIAALKSVNYDPKEQVLLLGAGGVAKAILFAIRLLGNKQVIVANRNIKNIRSLDNISVCKSVPWSERHKYHASLIINATPVGMKPDSDVMPVNIDCLRRARAVLDVVVSPINTLLIENSRKQNKVVAPGFVMSLEQAMAQFKIYTGHDAPKEIMKQSMLKLLND
jgi:shikimate dehydrogenase